MKKSICWVTSGYLLQVDLPILYKIKEWFNLKWVVYAEPGSDMAQHALDYARKHEIDIMVFSSHHHRYCPLIYFDFAKQMRMLSKIDADIYYFNIIAFPYLIFAIKHDLPSTKVVMAMHHGAVPTLMDFKLLYRYYLKFLCAQPFTFQYFSQSQAAYFTGNQDKCHVINLSLNNYGKSTLQPPKDYVSFLFFGVIIGTKNVAGIIQAACIVKERTQKKFKVKIVGHCRDWKPYEKLIRYPEIFDLKIERVPDNIIPDLFSSSHYLLQPYTFVSQSGPLRMAYGYNLPVITSDLEGFKEYVIDGVTGRVCKAGDVESLAKVMQEVIDNHPEMYNTLRSKQAEYIKENISQEVILAKYKSMFNKVVSEQI